MPEILLRGGPCNGQKYNVSDLADEFYASYDASPFASFTQGVEGMPPPAKLQRAKYLRFGTTFEYIWAGVGNSDEKPKRQWTIRTIWQLVTAVAEPAAVLASVVTGTASTWEPGHINLELAFDSVGFLAMAIYLAVRANGVKTE